MSGEKDRTKTTTCTRREEESDYQALRAWVTAPSSAPPAADVLVLEMTHGHLQQRHVEIRFSQRYDTVATLQQRIHRQTGTAPCHQHLQFYQDTSHKNSQPFFEAPPDVLEQMADWKLAETATNRSSSSSWWDSSSSPRTTTPNCLGLISGQTVVHCLDLNPFSLSKDGGLENVHLVKKFTLTEEQYQARPGTLRSWIQQQRSADPSFTLEKYAAAQVRRGNLHPPNPGTTHEDKKNPAAEEEEEKDHVYGPASVQGLQVGDRCQIQPGARRGQVAWVGRLDPTARRTAASRGYWVGVVLDEPVGHHDGTWPEGAAGQPARRYFTTTAPHGVYVRGPNVQVGDYPERDLWDDDDDDDEDDQQEEPPSPDQPPEPNDHQDEL